MADFPIGMAVSAGDENRSMLDIQAKQETIAHHFSQLTAGNIMKMRYLHPQENTYDWTEADELVSWAETNGLSIHGHTFIWHSDYQVPDFMKNYIGDANGFETLLDSHVTTIADHFRGKVDSWDVVNEALHQQGDGVGVGEGNCYRNSLFYQKLGKDYLANAFTAAKAADSGADLYYNDFSTEGGDDDKFACLLILVDDLLDNDIAIDGVGFQMHVQIDWPSTDDIAAAFQAIVDRGLKVKITELEVPVNNPWGAASFPQYTSFSEAAATRQKARYKAIVETYLTTVPANLRGGITVWGLWDGDSWLLNLSERAGSDDWPLLFTGDANGPYEPKPAFYGVAEALSEE
ncbi:endo-1,4-beta-xylanase [Teredinibacter franksiae]|uniref:endo-1,4-beta-xylanase n=1 Tax=Teredinibacter franksiae TaxID=2761453 RepID=UPI001FE48358|nr:endo-1,4-beta-xylanase [Teredinibacter franksiae]